MSHFRRISREQGAQVLACRLAGAGVRQQARATPDTPRVRRRVAIAKKHPARHGRRKKNWEELDLALAGPLKWVNWVSGFVHDIFRYKLCTLDWLLQAPARTRAEPPESEFRELTEMLSTPRARRCARYFRLHRRGARARAAAGRRCARDIW